VRQPRAIEIDDLVLDPGELRRLLRLLVGSLVVRPDGLAFAIQRNGRELSLLPIDVGDLATSCTLN
jgi:hypothetical protein